MVVSVSEGDEVDGEGGDGDEGEWRGLMVKRGGVM